MPSKTPAQAKLMRAVAHGWKPDRIKGPSRKVAKEFVAADKKAKGYQYGGLAKMLEELKRKQDPDYDPFARYGTEPLTLKQAAKRSGKKGFLKSTLTAAREMGKAGWNPSGEGKNAKWYPPQATLTSPSEDVPPRTTQPIPGEGGLLEETPPAKAVTPASLRAEIPERLRGMIAGAGRTPPALLQYLQQLRGPAPEPVEMQRGGAMDFMFRGRLPPRLQRGAGRGQPPGRGGLARAAVQPGGGRMTSDMGMRAGQARRGQVPRGGMPGGSGSPIQGFIDRGGLEGRQLRRPGGGGGVGQGQPRPQPGGGPPPMKGIGRAPGAGVPLRGVGRPPGMGRPGAGGNVQAAVMPGRGFMPGGGGAGTSGGANRIGMGDQQGAQARAMQVQTGRPPISRRQPFPGRGGPGGGFGRSRGRRRGRMRR